MYQLIGITIDFFAFNTITKIDVKSNENDFNYPFITLLVNDQSFENMNVEFLMEAEDDSVLFLQEKVYDKSCDLDLMWREVTGSKLNWTRYFLLNCRKWQFRQIINKTIFSEKVSRLNTTFIVNKMLGVNYGWYLTNSIGSQNSLTYGYTTYKLGFKQTIGDVFEEIIHLDLNHLIDKINIELMNILFHSQPVSHLNDMSLLSIKLSAFNNTFIVRKVSRFYLEPPFGNCSYYYSNTNQPFNASSHMQCYRRCLIYFARKHIGCEPVFVDNFISELDLEPNEEYNETNVCLYDKYLEFEEKRKTLQLNKKCVNLCPKDCLTVDYFYDIMETDSHIRNDYWNELKKSEKFSKKSLIWDSTQPMFEYKEVGVMSFTDYLSSFGGIMGLWFGVSANDIINWIYRKMPWTLLSRNTNVVPFV